jgi:hypothetical protein
VASFKASNVDLVVLEATGGYERGRVCALQLAGINVARVNPRQARDFAKSINPMLDEHTVLLAGWMTRRRQLVDMRVAEGNRLEHAHAKSAVRSIKNVLKTRRSCGGSNGVPPGPEIRYGVHFLSSGPDVTPSLFPLAPTLGRLTLAAKPLPIGGHFYAFGLFTTELASYLTITG